MWFDCTVRYSDSHLHGHLDCVPVSKPRSLAQRLSQGTVASITRFLRGFCLYTFYTLFEGITFACAYIYHVLFEGLLLVHTSITCCLRGLCFSVHISHAVRGPFTFAYILSACRHRQWPIGLNVLCAQNSCQKASKWDLAPDLSIWFFPSDQSLRLFTEYAHDPKHCIEKWMLQSVDQWP